MIKLTPMVSRSKIKWYKHRKFKKLALKSRLETHQNLKNNDSMLILCLSYSITTYCMKVSRSRNMKQKIFKISTSPKIQTNGGILNNCTD